MTDTTDREHLLALLREGADLLSEEVDGLKSGISIGDKLSDAPEDAHTISVIHEIEDWIRRAGEAHRNTCPAEAVVRRGE